MANIPEAMNCPPDIVEFGMRHNIPNFAEQTWKAGFMAGLRAANKLSEDDIKRIEEICSLLSYEDSLELLAKRMNIPYKMLFG